MRRSMKDNAKDLHDMIVQQRRHPYWILLLFIGGKSVPALEVYSHAKRAST